MTEYKIKLDVFEGPLDLLLHLIKEEEVSIYDIPISKITQQYFEYLEMMKQLNMEIAGEFLVMAATLVFIKSRMLLPAPPATGDEESGEDPREELVRRLLEYKKFKDSAAALRERESAQSDSFARNFPSEWDEDDADYLKEVSVFQLLALFRKVVAESGKPDLYEVTLEDVSVTEKMNELMELMETTPRIVFEELFRGIRNNMEIIGTFLALLELIKQQLVRAFQDNGRIWVQKTENGPTFTLTEAGADAENGAEESDATADDEPPPAIGKE
ncbi:MAG: segregation/condensation protein A [Nitrospinae bacterium]|nr:segregation/condensation protein A [Nitrospinota bacterium]